MMCKPRLLAQLLRPIRKNTLTLSALTSGQITGGSISYTTSTIIHLAKLNVEQDLPTHFNTSTHNTSPDNHHCVDTPTTMPQGHIIKDMLTASNIKLLYDETATPTLYHQSTGTTSTPYLSLVSADSVN